MTKVKRAGVLAFMFLAYFFLTYFGMPTSLLGTLVILLCSYLCWPGKWKEYLGIGLSPFTALACVALVGIVFASSYFIIKSICESNSIEFLAVIPLGFGTLHTLGQSFNEELLIGGLLLLFLKRKFKNRYLVPIAIAVALLFSLAHLAFYGLITQGPNSGSLSLLTLCDLFLVGLIRNALILFFESVYFAWAVHFGWNVAFFYTTVLSNFNEPRLFNTFLGSIQVFIFLLALLLACALCMFFMRNRRSPDSISSKGKE